MYHFNPDELHGFIRLVFQYFPQHGRIDPSWSPDELQANLNVLFAGEMKLFMVNARIDVNQGRMKLVLREGDADETALPYAQIVLGHRPEERKSYYIPFRSPDPEVRAWTDARTDDVLSRLPDKAPDGIPPEPASRTLAVLYLLMDRGGREAAEFYVDAGCDPEVTAHVFKEAHRVQAAPLTRGRVLEASGATPEGIFETLNGVIQRELERGLVNSKFVTGRFRDDSDAFVRHGIFVVGRFFGTLLHGGQIEEGLATAEDVAAAVASLPPGDRRTPTLPEVQFGTAAALMIGKTSVSEKAAMLVWTPHLTYEQACGLLHEEYEDLQMKRAKRH
jgi:hypothetical protein